ncbi:hypothetical protein C8Q75DRAFT_776626 [Abortiporus biennis]|nr:hypothetical protein C8Q75DRAFT_776626 [Abortiporus biennis]
MSTTTSDHELDDYVTIRAGNPFIAPEDGRCVINDLPPELLSRIFELGVEDREEEEDDEEEFDNSDFGDDDEEEVPFEILVSHVCKRWREVALEVPTLWTTIDFAEGEPYERTQVYLERSKSALIDISIDVTDDPHDSSDSEEEDEEDSKRQKEIVREVELMISLVEPHIYRWRTFEYMVSDYRPMQNVLLRLGQATSAPELQVLQLYHYEDADDYEHFGLPEYKEQDFVLFHGNVPNLRCVALWGVHLNWEKSTFLRGLSDLELAYHASDVRPSYRVFTRIIQDSPKISTLTLCESGPAGGPVEWLQSLIEGVNADRVTESSTSREISPSPIPSITTNISIPSLKELVFAYLDCDYACELLDRLAIPSVVELALDMSDADYTEFMVRLSRPSPLTGKKVLSGLESFKLSGMPCNLTSTKEALLALKNLKWFNVNFHFVDIAWYQLLFEYSEDSPSSTGPAAAATSAIPVTPIETPTQDSRVESNPSTANLGRKELYLPKLEVLVTTGLNGQEMRKLVEHRKTARFPLKRVLMNGEDEVSEEDQAWLSKELDTFEYFEGSDEDTDSDDDDLDFEVEFEDTDDEGNHAEIVEVIEMDGGEAGEGDEDEEAWTDED